MEKDKFQGAMKRLEEEGIKIWMHPIVEPYAPKLYERMLEYYIQREEYEKCQFLCELWERYQKSSTISKILRSLL